MAGLNVWKRQNRLLDRNGCNRERNREQKMAVLDNPQHEKFVQEYIKNGRNGCEAYKAVYPQIKTDEAADAAASRLLRTVNVSNRVKKLQAEAAEEAKLTLEVVRVLRRLPASKTRRQPKTP
jgi:phage terminase small subunit